MSTGPARKLLTLVVPAHNEEQNVPYFYGRARAVLDSLPDVDCRIVFVNNSSTDGTLEQVRLLRERDPRVKIVTL